MDLLARREHSRDELCKKLVSKGFSSEDIVTIADQLASEGLQDDARFAEAYVCHRVDAGFGPCRIVMELQERGVAESLIDTFVWKGAIDWRSLMETVWRRKFERAEPVGTKIYAAQVRFLMQRGFEPENIHHLLQHQTVEK